MQGNGSTSLVKSFFKSKWVIGVIIFNILLFIAVIIIAIINATKVSTVIFNVIPDDATISVGGNSGYKNGLQSITPGSYEVVISRDGLASKKLNINIEPNHVTNITAFLTNEDGSYTFYELQQNLEQLRKLESAAYSIEDTSDEQVTSAREFIEAYNIKENYLEINLPINHAEYAESSDSPSGRTLVKDITIRRGYGAECKTSLCIEALMTFTDNKDEVNQLLENKGIKADEYEINYKIY